jgi:hypothetical protein
LRGPRVFGPSSACRRPTSADLRAKGATFEEYDVPGLKTENGITTTPAGKGAWFKDEDGNIIGVFQPK